jgi:hypothetical protein
LLGTEIERGGDLFERVLLVGDGIQEALAIVEALGVESVEELESGGLPVRERGVTGDQERISASAEPAGGLTWCGTAGGSWVECFPWQCDAARESGAWGVEF